MSDKAIVGLLASQAGRNPRFDPKDDAAYCYSVADAMLAEKKKREGK